MTTPDVAVTVEGNDAPPVSDDTVVVVTPAAEDSGDDLAIGIALGQLTVAFQALQAEVSEIRGSLAQTQATAEVAESVAATAVDIAIDAAAEADAALEEAEEIQADNETEVIEPDREHWLWKRRGGLKPVAE